SGSPSTPATASARSTSSPTAGGWRSALRPKGLASSSPASTSMRWSWPNSHPTIPAERGHDSGGQRDTCRNEAGTRRGSATASGDRSIFCLSLPPVRIILHDGEKCAVHNRRALRQPASGEMPAATTHRRTVRGGRGGLRTRPAIMGKNIYVGNLPYDT